MSIVMNWGPGAAGTRAGGGAATAAHTGAGRSLAAADGPRYLLMRRFTCSASSTGEFTGGSSADTRPVALGTGGAATPRGARSLPREAIALPGPLTTGAGWCCAGPSDSTCHGPLVLSRSNLWRRRAGPIASEMRNEPGTGQKDNTRHTAWWKCWAQGTRGPLRQLSARLPGISPEWRRNAWGRGRWDHNILVQLDLS